VTQIEDLSTPQPQWRARGYLPHLESHALIQHVVFHLADAIPGDVWRAMAADLALSPTYSHHLGTSGPWQDLLDEGRGSCLLALPSAAALVQDALRHHDGTRVGLFAWVVMPNHVHVLARSRPPWTLAKTIASWKAWTGSRLAAMAREQGRFAALGPFNRVWAREYWDRAMRTEEDVARTLRLIRRDPVRAGLVKRPEDWPWGSAGVGELRSARLSLADPAESKEPLFPQGSA
jgi:putative transposase